MLFNLLRAARRWRAKSETATAHTNKTSRKLMTDSLVEKISDWATMIGIGIGVIAWWFAREDANRKSSELENYKIVSSKEIANTNERANKLAKDAEQLRNDTMTAKLELAKLKEKTAWRQISEKQKKRFISEVSSIPDKEFLRIAAINPTDEIAQYATSIASMLRAAGYVDHDPNIPVFPGRRMESVVGITIRARGGMFSPPRPSNDIFTISLAFSNIGIESKIFLTEEIPDQRIEIWIGDRQPL